jgi:hypothetical protein
MMNFRGRSITLSAITLVMASIAILPADDHAFIDKTLTSFSSLQPGANETLLYKGVPRKASVADVAKRKFSQGGFQFYDSPVPMDARDSQAILSMVLDPESHHVHGDKFCGGFHPDFTIHWKHPKGLLKIMVCMSCHEWKVSDGKLGLYTDIPPDVFNKLIVITNPYLGRNL